MQASRLLPSAAVAAVLTVICIFVIDQPFARWIATRETYPDVWNTVIGWLEYPLGIEPYKWTGVWVLGLGTLATLAVPRLRNYAFAFALITLVHLIGRNLMSWLKFGFGRYRPTQWLKAGAPDDTFFVDDKWSFPSGHAILFASILVPLAVVYPRTRPLLVIVAFAMTARVAVNAHFISDVLGGYVVVALTTWLCVAWLRRALPSEIQPASLR